MGDAASGQSDGAGKRRGRPSTTGSSVLTPPTGMPALPDIEAFPSQRTDSGHSGPLPVQPPAPPAQRTVVEPCTCGHGRAAHEHYRPGSDCGTCGRSGCGEFRPENGRWRRLMRKVGLLG